MTAAITATTAIVSTTSTTATKPAEPLRAPHCPVCGEANGCVPAATGSFDQPCWCAGHVIDPGVIARVPEAMRGRACLCPRCAASSLAAASTSA